MSRSVQQLTTEYKEQFGENGLKDYSLGQFIADERKREEDERKKELLRMAIEKQKEEDERKKELLRMAIEKEKQEKEKYERKKAEDERKKAEDERKKELLRMALEKQKEEDERKKELLRMAIEKEKQEKEKYQAETQRMAEEAKHAEEERKRKAEEAEKAEEERKKREYKAEDLVDLSTPDAIVEWMENIAEKHQFALRTDAFDPGAPFDKPAFGGKCWDREPVIREAIQYFENALGAGPGSMQHTGICATLATRGCGKTFLLDRLCRLHSSGKEKNILGDDLNPRLVPVAISFSSPQSIREDSGSSASALLLSRLCHRTFFDTRSVFWTQFIRATRGHWDRVTEWDVFSAMVKWFKRCGVEDPIVLIAVDEIATCDAIGPDFAIAAMNILKFFIDVHTSNCRLFVTTFDDNLPMDGICRTADGPVVKRVRFGSHRPIYWLPLVPLTLDGPREAMETLDITNAELGFLLSLSGGHPRSLALLQELLSHSRKRTLVDLVKAWEDDIMRYCQEVDEDVFETLLAMSLVGERLTLTDRVKGMSVQELVQDTVLMNAMNPTRNSPFVPQLSLLRIHHWTTRPQPEELHTRLRTLLDLGQDLEHRSFQQFHLLFEELRCWAWHKLGRDRTTTLMTWFPTAQLVCGGNRDIEVPTLEFRYRTALPRLRDLDKVPRNYVLAARDQPGFAFLGPMGNLLLLFECRYSQPAQSEAGSTLQSAAEDVRRKAVLAESEVEKSTTKFNDIVVDPKCCGFISIAHRDSIDDIYDSLSKQCKTEPSAEDVKGHEIWAKFKNLSMPVLVLKRPGVLKRYGPTFAALGISAIDYSTRHDSDHS